MQEGRSEQGPNPLRWLFWLSWGFFAIVMGTGVGVTLGTVNQDQGTTIAVVIGMGLILCLRWLAQRIVSISVQSTQSGWNTIPVKAGFILGAVNLSVAAVLISVSIWRVVWPGQILAWNWIGGEIGAIASILGGMMTGLVLAQASQD